jgi:uncharacterized membrane protein
MEDHSQHPLNSEIPFQPHPNKNRLNFWFFITIFLFAIGFGFANQKSFGGFSLFALLGGVFTAVMTVGHWIRALRENLVSRKSLTDFELAQERLKTHQRTRTLALLWFGAFGLLILLTIPMGGDVAGTLFPFMVLALFMSAFYGLQACYSSPQKLLDKTLIEKEMIWLFEETWRDNTGAFEYTFAQDRIRSRRRNRLIFVMHLLLFLPINAFALFAGFAPPTTGLEQLCLTVPIIWTVFLLLPHAIQAFPTAGMLARRERKVAQNLQAEIDSMYPSKSKNEEKAKTDNQYRVGDDGELVEIEGDELLEDEKPKRERRG